jgi:L-histidine N-alpha-methyltransferase
MTHDEWMLPAEMTAMRVTRETAKKCPLNETHARALQIKHLGEIIPGMETEEPSGHDIVQGLTRVPKSLPSKYFYDHRGSQLFEQICCLPEYYLTRTEASILRRYADKIAETTGACELVELGSGSSTKTRLLLDGYLRKNYTCRYVPIDVNESILRSSATQLEKEYPCLQIEALAGTYEQALANLKPARLPVRMVLFLGSSIGNSTTQECDHFFHQITEALSPGDYFLLGVDLRKSRKMLEAAYNDSQGLTAAFNLNILEHINRGFNANFNISLFSHQAIYNEEESQIEMYLYCQESHLVQIEDLDLQVSWEIGEKLLTEISRKFDLETLRSQLESHKLKTIEICTDPQKWFGLLLCQAVK